MYDILIRNAYLRGAPGLSDFGVLDGRIMSIAAGSPRQTATRILDIGGRMVLPSFVDAHMHLDTALTLGRPRHNRSGTLAEGIEIWGELKSTLTFEEIRDNAMEALLWEVAKGTGFIRCHVDICDPELRALRALREVREAARGLCEVQLVAFPQDGALTFPSGRRLMREAVELGCDVIGGIPHQAPTYSAGCAELDFVFDLATQFDLDIDCHCDETDDPNSRFVNALVERTEAAGWHGRVTASQCTAMAGYPSRIVEVVSRRLASAGISVIVCPFVNVLLQGRGDTSLRRRGIAPIRELLANGVNVAVGYDSIMDAWLALGDGDMLAAAQLALLLGQLSGSDETQVVLDLVTTNGARAMGIRTGYGLADGDHADFVVLDAVDPAEALRLVPERLFVFHRGRQVASTEPARSTIAGATGREITFRPPGRVLPPVREPT
ncbi:amidohydrolase family protein [Nocardia abscessus]|uniref:amidohydrolase family protein n=1 Tax=Nocardia abscessus TaxID=120957 RepID=UPI0005BA6985|nr:amidohydrolase family protein [Nocardia abscessus]MCC3327943.1 amidohydrolase family protein [Nocardia abscessus]